MWYTSHYTTAYVWTDAVETEKKLYLEDFFLRQASKRNKDVPIKIMVQGETAKVLKGACLERVTVKVTCFVRLFVE